MKVTKKAVVIVAACLISACGGNVAVDDGSSSLSPSPLPPESPAPSAIEALLDSKCDVRPSPIQQGEEIGGQQFSYTESLAEKDETDVIEGGSSLLVKNLNGLLYVEPSSDGKVYWAARKWVLSETQENAESALSNVTISSTVEENKASVEVSQPASSLPGTRYEVCLVAMAPPEWANDLNDGSGDIEIQGLAGDVVIENGSGDVSVDTSSDKELKVSSQSGDIVIISTGSGKITSTNASGDISVNADSRVAVDLSDQSGSVYYTLTNSGASYQHDSIVSTESGSIVLNLADGLGLHIDAEVLTGSIEVPDVFPAPESSGITGERFVADINGGGAVLTIRATTGTIGIETSN